MDLKRKPRIGLLLIGAERFMKLGAGTAGGTYEARKKNEAEKYVERFSEFAEVVFDGIVCERGRAEDAARGFYARKVDCAVAIFLSWAEDFAWIRFLRELPPMPLLLASVVRDSLSISDTNDEDQFVDFLSAGSLVGFQEASGSFARFNRPMSETCLGTLDEVAACVSVFANAAKTRSILRSTRLSLLACYNEAMWATYVDPYNVFYKIGPELHFLSVAGLVNEIKQTGDRVVDGIIERLQKQYKIMPNVDFAKFRESVKATVAMETLAKKAGTDLLVLNDIDTVLFENVGLRPGFTPTDPDETMVTVPEGDIGGGVATYILQILSGETANFIEPFYIDHARSLFVAGHAGPNNYHGRPQNTIIARDERFAKSGWKHAGAPFAWHVFPEGEKTMLHMSERDGRMKMVASVVDCLPTRHYLASYSHAEFRHRKYTPGELFGKICAVGVTQHYGIAPGNHLDELEALAKMCDFEFVRID